MDTGRATAQPGSPPNGMPVDAPPIPAEKLTAKLEPLHEWKCVDGETPLPVRSVQFAPRALPSRHKAEQDAGNDRCAEGEREHVAVEANIVDARQVAGIQVAQRA